jgi:hypothetical protein
MPRHPAPSSFRAAQAPGAQLLQRAGAAPRRTCDRRLVPELCRSCAAAGPQPRTSTRRRRSRRHRPRDAERPCTTPASRAAAALGPPSGQRSAGAMQQLGRSRGRRHGVGVAVATSPARRSAPAQLLHREPPRPSGRRRDSVPPELCRGPTAAQRRGNGGAGGDGGREDPRGNGAAARRTPAFRFVSAAQPLPPAALPELCGRHRNSQPPQQLATAAAETAEACGRGGTASHRHRHHRRYCRSHAGAAGTEEGRMPLASAPLGFRLSAGRR